MARTKMVDGIRIELTDAENEQRDREETAWAAGAFDRAISGLREARNRRLRESDWYALQDVTLSPEVRSYRQSLRDLPSGLSTVEDVKNVSWPVKPAG